MLLDKIKEKKEKVWGTELGTDGVSLVMFGTKVSDSKAF